MAPVNKSGGKRGAKPGNLLCCRACLATEGKLFNMRDCKLLGEFFRVSGIALREKEKLPQHLCVWCTALMQRCAAFRGKSLRANECLQRLQGEMTMENIRSIDRFANRLVDLAQTKIEFDSIDCSDAPEPEPMVLDDELEDTDTEIADVTNKGLSIPVEPMPIAKNNKRDTTKTEVPNVARKELFIEIDSLNKNEIKINIVKENNIKDTTYETGEVFDVDYLDDDLDNTNTPLENDDTITEPTKIVKDAVKLIKTRKRNGDTSISEVKIKRGRPKKNKDSMSGVKRKRGRRVKEDKGNVGKANGRKPHKYRSSEDNYMPTVDLEEVKATYNVDIAVLTHDEQMAELELRRTTDEYQLAPFKCDPCGKYFRHEEAYNHHMPKHDKKRGPFECPTCQFRFHRRGLQVLHYDKHKMKFICKQCGFVSKNIMQAKLHHQWHAGRKYQCQHCGKIFQKISTYLGHVRLRHQSLHESCNMCGETFVNEKSLLTHKRFRHGVAKKKELMECATCSVTFINVEALERHKMAAGEHGAASPCETCGETFDAEEDLKEHVTADHPSCQECNLRFLNSESFAIHIKRKHLNKGSPEASKRAAANRRARALGLPPPFPPATGHNYTKRQVCCEICGKLFYNPKMLDYHLRRHRGEKLPFPCTVCPKSFFTSQQLQDHTTSHTGEKPYKCELCDVNFTTKTNLRRHIHAIHMANRPKIECTICGRYLSTRFTLKMHIRTVHNGEPWPKRAPRKKKQLIVYRVEEETEVMEVAEEIEVAEDTEVIDET